MSLVALSEVEAWLQLSSGNSDEALLTRLINAASAFVETWCSRTFTATAYVEPRNGNGQTRVTPNSGPLIAVSSVLIDGTSIPATSVGATTNGFFVVGKSIYLRGYAFNRGEMNVVLSYTAGFATIPADVQQAVIELVAMRYRERDRIGMSSVNAGGETTSYVIKDMPPSVATLLTQYRVVVVR